MMMVPTDSIGTLPDWNVMPVVCATIILAIKRSMVMVMTGDIIPGIAVRLIAVAVVAGIIVGIAITELNT